MDLFSQPKVDTHCHLLDPMRFPYAADVAYRPQGQETGGQALLEAVMDCHGVRHALLVQPNSGYHLDNRCLLHALATGKGRFRGVVVLADDTPREALARLKAQGVAGVAFNVAMFGLDFYRGIGPLLDAMAAEGLWADIQVQGDQLVELLPVLADRDLPLVFDHYGRPDVARGIGQAGFRALLALGREGRAAVKFSGEAKVSAGPFPFDDLAPFVDALVKAFGVGQCLWASDWPNLRAPFRIDYGPMLQRWQARFDAAGRQAMLWDNPLRLFGFGASGLAGGAVPG